MIEKFGAHHALYAGSIISFLLKILGYFLSYAFIMLIIRIVGTEGFGEYSLWLNYFNVLALLASLGFPTVVLRLVSQLNTDVITAAELYKKISISILTVSGFLGATVYLFADFFSHLISNSSVLVYPLKVSAFFIGLFAFLSVNIETIRAYKGILISEYFRHINLPLIACILLFFHSYYFKALDQVAILAYLVAGVVGVVLSYIWIFQRFRTQQPRIKSNYSLDDMNIYAIALPVLGSSVLNVLLGAVDTMIIGKYLSLADLGVYQVALRLSTIVSLFLGSINTMVAPLIAQHFWNKNESELLETIRQSSKLMIFSSLPLCIVIVLFREPLLSLFGKDFLVGSQALLYLIVGQIMNVACGSVGIFLNMTGNQSIFQRILFFAFIFNITANFIFVPHGGIEAAAMINMFTISGWNIFSAYYIWRKYQIRTFYWRNVEK